MDHWCWPLRSASSLDPEGWCLRKAACPRILVRPGEPKATSMRTDMWPWAKRQNVSAQGRAPGTMAIGSLCRIRYLHGRHPPTLQPPPNTHTQCSTFSSFGGTEVTQRVETERPGTQPLLR